MSTTMPQPAWLQTREGRKAMQALNDGDSVAAVSGRFGVSKRYLIYACVWARRLPANLKRYVELYEAGTPPGEILKQTQLTRHLFYELLDALEVERQHQTRSRPRCAICNKHNPSMQAKYCGEDCRAIARGSLSVARRLAHVD